KSKIASTGSFNILSSTDEQNIRAMAAKTGATAINAQNALSLFKGEDIERFAEPIILIPNNARLLQPQTSNAQLQSGIDYKLNNYPNPFNESTVLEATIPTNTSGEIVITDVTGKQIQRVVLNNTDNKVELRGNELGYGIFFYSLYINGEYIQTKKLTRIQ
ncbi:MAG TPA: T9SS type A sorting domain-containing protein, partial [Vicingus sp.]|nr:T9SS type A sorting domain-containing protein [Vicingus sp.]